MNRKSEKSEKRKTIAYFHLAHCILNHSNYQLTFVRISMPIYEYLLRTAQTILLLLYYYYLLFEHFVYLCICFVQMLKLRPNYYYHSNEKKGFKCIIQMFSFYERWRAKVPYIHIFLSYICQDMQSVHFGHLMEANEKIEIKWF